MSEDCLFLNIWTPDTKGPKRPVMVWIPGGAFISGSGSVPIYDGKNLAAQGIVVVTLNYRLGVFGFLAYPALTAEARRADEPPGNFGLQDMIAALKWLHHNIAAFGGDPNAITIAGQSAGSIAVHELIASPFAAGLFARAIAESGFSNTMPTPSLANAERAGEAFARSKGADSLAALRALPASDLVSSSPVPSFIPIVDGTLLPAAPEQLLAQGRFTHTPILLGMNDNENTGFSGPLKPASPHAWKLFLEKTFGSRAPQFARLYPAKNDAERTRAIHLVRRDLGLGAFYSWARLRLSHANGPVYGYLWTHAEPGPESSRWGAFHSSEIPYAFRTLDKSPWRHFTEADKAISTRISDYWLNFIKTGNPNGRGLPTWPKLQFPNLPIMQIGTVTKPRPMLAPEELRAIESYIQQGGTPHLFSVRP